MLWLEREFQIVTRNHTFRLPYWDWRDPMQRDVLFKRDRLGENNNGNVEGIIFGDKWKTICWENTEGQTSVPICNPKKSGQNLRRCPNAVCDKSNENWPSYDDVATAITIMTIIGLLKIQITAFGIHCKK